MGNLRSVCRAWERAGARVRLCQKVSEVGRPGALVFPGQGGMEHCVKRLQETGFDQLLVDWIGQDRPFFGICLGLQVLFEGSEEGHVEALGIFPGTVRRFRLPPEYKIPHMGWNAVTFYGGGEKGLLEGIDSGRDQFYFVHSYHVETADRSLVWAETEYGYPFVSGIRRGRCLATQFHPEKSQAKGLQMYRNFVQSMGVE